MKPIYALTSFVLLHFIPLAIEAQTSAPISPVLTTERFSLLIATKQSTYKVGEKILVNVSLKNISDEQYCENHFLETGEAELNGYHPNVINASGETLALINKRRERGMRSRGNVCINPGEILKEVLSIDQLVNINAPGIYQIQVDHLDRGNNVYVHSNSVSVTIAQ